ncbi:hypothetical protein ACFU6N_40490, partial [Streptomyces sp. NPDC057496]
MTALPSPHRRTLLLAPLAAATACGAPSDTDSGRTTDSGASSASGASGNKGRPALRTQPGITTVQPAHVLLLAHDLSPARPSLEDVRRVLSDWWTDQTS